MTTVGIRCVYGLDDRATILGIVDLPVDAIGVRIRCRPDSFATVTVRTKSSTTRYAIRIDGDTLRLGPVIACNFTIL